MKPPVRLPALAIAALAGLFATASPRSAEGDDTYVITLDEDEAEAVNPLVVLCKADPERCKEVLAARMEELRQMVEAERAAQRRGETPSLTEAGALADRLLVPSHAGAAEERGLAAERLAWLASRHRWSHPIPPELTRAVARAWESPFLSTRERMVLADAAMTLGHADALDLLVSRIGKGGAGDAPPPRWLLRRHTDAPRSARSPEALQAWLGAHRAGLRFDPFVRRWRAAP